MRRVIAFRPFWGLLISLLPLAGCGKAPEAPVVQPPIKQFVVAVSLCKTDGVWRTQMKADIEAAAAKHPDLRLVIRDAKDDAAKQEADLEEFLGAQVNLVIVSPKDVQAVTETVAKLIDAGIPVVVLDRPVIGDKYSCYISADIAQLGETAGRWLAARLQGKGKIVEIKGPVDSLPDETLHTAFRTAFRDPGFRFVFDDCVDPPRSDAGKLMGDALNRVQQIDAVFAYDDAAAKAAYDAAKAAGREKGVLFLGVGGMPDEGEGYVKEGILDATFLYPTGGAEAIDNAVKLLRGQSVPKKIVPATRAITKEAKSSSLLPGEG
jgi:ribose transport system substrate-binding protein